MSRSLSVVADRPARLGRFSRLMLCGLVALALVSLIEPPSAKAIGWRRHYFRAYMYVGEFGPYWPPHRGSPWWYAQIPYGYGNWQGWQGYGHGHGWYGEGPYMHGDEVIVPEHDTAPVLPPDETPPVPPDDTVYAPSGEGPLTVLTLRVPADAKVYLSGKPTSSTGPMRVFGTRRLEPGQRYVNYTVRVEVQRGEELLVREKNVTLAAGEQRMMDIPTEELVATRP